MSSCADKRAVMMRSRKKEKLRNAVLEELTPPSFANRTPVRPAGRAMRGASSSPLAAARTQQSSVPQELLGAIDQCIEQLDANSGGSLLAGPITRSKQVTITAGNAALGVKGSSQAVNTLDAQVASVVQLVRMLARGGASEGLRKFLAPARALEVGPASPIVAGQTLTEHEALLLLQQHKHAIADHEVRKRLEETRAANRAIMNQSVGVTKTREKADKEAEAAYYRQVIAEQHRWENDKQQQHKATQAKRNELRQAFLDNQRSVAQFEQQRKAEELAIDHAYLTAATTGLERQEAAQRAKKANLNAVANAQWQEHVQLMADTKTRREAQKKTDLMFLEQRAEQLMREDARRAASQAEIAARQNAIEQNLGVNVRKSMDEQQRRDDARLAKQVAEREQLEEENDRRLAQLKKDLARANGQAVRGQIEAKIARAEQVKAREAVLVQQWNKDLDDAVVEDARRATERRQFALDHGKNVRSQIETDAERKLHASYQMDERVRAMNAGLLAEYRALGGVTANVNPHANNLGQASPVADRAHQLMHNGIGHLGGSSPIC